MLAPVRVCCDDVKFRDLDAGLGSLACSAFAIMTWACEDRGDALKRRGKLRYRPEQDEGKRGIAWARTGKRFTASVERKPASVAFKGSRTMAGQYHGCEGVGEELMGFDDLEIDVDFARDFTTRNEREDALGFYGFMHEVTRLPLRAALHDFTNPMQ